MLRTKKTEALLWQKNNALFASLLVLVTAAVLYHILYGGERPVPAVGTIVSIVSDCAHGRHHLSTMADIVAVAGGGAGGDCPLFHETLRAVYEIEEEKSNIVIPGPFPVSYTQLTLPTNREV